MIWTPLGWAWVSIVFFSVRVLAAHKEIFIISLLGTIIFAIIFTIFLIVLIFLLLFYSFLNPFLLPSLIVTLIIVPPTLRLVTFLIFLIFPLFTVSLPLFSLLSNLPFKRPLVIFVIVSSFLRLLIFFEDDSLFSVISFTLNSLVFSSIIFVAWKSFVSFIFVVLVFPLKILFSIPFEFLNRSPFFLALRSSFLISPHVVLSAFVLISTSSVLIFDSAIIVSAPTSRWA